MKRAFLIAIVTVLTIAALYSCSKKTDNNNSTSRKIKYEITGTFSGKLNIVYNDNVNGNTTLTNITLPWTKEINYGSNVMAIGIGAQANTTGITGQTATLKIYSGGVVAKTSTATAGSLGEILIPTITYQF